MWTERNIPVNCKIPNQELFAMLASAVLASAYFSCSVYSPEEKTSEFIGHKCYFYCSLTFDEKMSGGNYVHEYQQMYEI